MQGLILKWQAKVLPTAESFTEALYQARTAEEQERQLAEIHKRDLPRGVLSRPLMEMPQKSGEKSGEKAQQGKRMLRCFKCHGTGHFARECPLGRGAPAEARGSSSMVKDELPPTQLNSSSLLGSHHLPKPRLVNWEAVQDCASLCLLDGMTIIIRTLADSSL